MSRFRLVRLTWPVLVWVGFVSACGGDGGTQPPPPPEPPRPTTVTVSPGAAELATPGETVQLTAEVRDQRGNVMGAAAVTWESSSAAVATVSGSGLVTATGYGTATITATAGSARGSAQVTLNPDRAPLVALYEATNGPAWARNDNWLTDAPIRDWSGVGTDTDGRVVWIDLSGELDGQGGWMRNGLAGTIPPELGRLDRLRNLWLYGNAISGTIPATLGDLAALEQLDLSDNELTGPIPPELGGLAELKQLVLHRNSLGEAIPPELGSLADLRVLSVHTNALSGPIPTALGDLASLEHLSLFGNDLVGPIPPELGGLTRLSQLWLNENRLAGAIPPELGNLPALRGLLLYDNELSGPIPPELANLTGLTSLDLQENALTGGIPAELGRTGLEKLDLRANRLTGTIPPALADLDGLTHLGLGGNAFTGPLPTRLGELGALERMLLEDNELEGPVPAEFGALTALLELNLTNNAGLAGTLPSELLALARLDVLLAGGTELCAPSERDFEMWLDGVYRRRIARCPEPGPMAAYLTQAVQSRDFPVPLVAGEEALLRVLLAAGEATSAGIPPVRARFYVNDREVYVQDVPGKQFPIPVTLDESSLDRSANALIPGEVIQPGLEMVIDVDPEQTLDPALGVTGRIPGNGRLRVDVRAVPRLDLTLVPFVWSENPDSSIVDLVSAMAADPANHEMLHDTRTLLPVADLDVRAHEPVAFPTQITGEMLHATEVIRVMEGGRGHYMAMMVGNLGGVAFRPGWSSFSLPHGPTLAHELGHNMNLWHAPCGGAPNPDPAYPHEEGAIGAWGYDFRGRLIEPSVKDLMTYCGDSKWISDFYFGNAMGYRLSDQGRPAMADRVTEARSLLLWGGVGAGGGPFLEPAFVVDAPASLPDAAGEYRLSGQATDGAEVFSLSFAMPAVLDGDGGSAFVFALPVQSSWAGALASITLAGPGGSVVLDGDSARPVAIMRDPRSGQVRGFLRDARAEDAMQVAAMAAPGAGAAPEVLFSRGIPDAEGWRR